VSYGNRIKIVSEGSGIEETMKLW